MARNPSSTASPPRAERLLQLLVEGQEVPLIGLDADGEICCWNDAARRITGYREEVAVGQELSFLFRGETGAAEAARLIREAGSEGRARASVELRREDGSRQSTELTLTAMREDGEEPFGFTALIGECRDRTASAERAEKRMAFLARASEELASSLDYEKTLQTVARLAVPEVADWAAVDIVEDGQVRRLAVHHQDPKKVELVRSLEEKYPTDPDAPHGAPQVIRTGKSEIMPSIPDELLADAAQDDEHLELLRQLGLRSYIAAPLLAHDEVVGVITFVQSESERPYTDEDRLLAEDIARRAGLAIHNARTVRELETTRGRLEKQASELATKEEELRGMLQRMRLHVEQTPLANIEWDTDLRIGAWNPAAERIFGYDADEAIGQDLCFTLSEEQRAEAGETFRKLLARRDGSRTRMRHTTKDGDSITCDWYNTALLDADGQAIGAASLVEDVTERADAEEQSQRQVEQLNALRTIDLAITASLDLRVTLNVLLDQVVTQLDVDAGSILLLNQHTQRLEFAAGRGFRTMGIQRSELLLGECSAGKAALDRRTLSVPNLATSDQFTRAPLLVGEEFVTHYSTPLVAKGRVAGVLEVFHREPLHTDTEWVGFLEALAGQAAIAVESAKLFEELQKSNLELVLAYDTTLDGWARALDLRDNVTEGHTQRVTEMAIRLARAMGIEDADLVHLRRGALLHDIGKMGIPDSILHKPGPLTDEEWEEMRKHPVYAYELLSSIDFLRPALDIPYAHHEHWDGTGYPRGLKGDAIPLAARIFAVVDIWDALRSDRPYNGAWPADRVREHIRSLAGTHLDPEVADVFLSLDW